MRTFLLLALAGCTEATTVRTDASLDGTAIDATAIDATSDARTDAAVPTLRTITLPLQGMTTSVLHVEPLQLHGWWTRIDVVVRGAFGDHPSLKAYSSGHPWGQCTNTKPSDQIGCAFTVSPAPLQTELFIEFSSTTPSNLQSASIRVFQAP